LQVAIEELVSLDVLRVLVHKGEEASVAEGEDVQWGSARSAVVVVEWEARHLDLLDDESDGYLRIDRFPARSVPLVSVVNILCARHSTRYHLLAHVTLDIAPCALCTFCCDSGSTRGSETVIGMLIAISTSSGRVWDDVDETVWEEVAVLRVTPEQQVSSGDRHR